MLRDEKLAAKVYLRWTEQPKPAQDQEVNICIATKKKKKKERMKKKQPRVKESGPDQAYIDHLVS